MDTHWMRVMLVMSAFGLALPTTDAQAAKADRLLQEIESGCHRLIMAHECRSFMDALAHASNDDREHILTEYLATIEERQSECRCELAAAQPANPQER